MDRQRLEYGWRDASLVLRGITGVWQMGLTTPASLPGEPALMQMDSGAGRNGNVFKTKASVAVGHRVIITERKKGQETRLQQNKTSHREATEENKATLSVNR